MPPRKSKNFAEVPEDESENEEKDIDSDEEGGLRVDDEIYIPPPPNNMERVNTGGPRLMIVKIVNENFKSYAGQKTIGPFHKCFSAIVGPNGSGKSNVIDSMLFVFGYRASKIRSKNFTVLIHNSKENPDSQFCRVSVFFQLIVDKEGSEYDVVPNSEFVISRVATKDKQNFYEINGEKTKISEVTKLLKSHGVDMKHNRFLILQGEVEQIALMKPKGQNENDIGMLEFLEDIIGTVRYKLPLEKLYDKVESKSELRVEKLNRLKIAEKEKKELEEPMKEAVEYLKAQNHITRFQHQYYQLQKLEATEKLAEEEQKKSELDEDLNKLKTVMQEMMSEKDEMIKDMKIKCKKWDAFQKQKDDINERLSKIRNTDEALHQELFSTNKRRKDDAANIITENQNLDALNKIPEKNEKKIEEYEQFLEKNGTNLKKEENALAELRESLKGKAEPFLKERADLEAKLIPLKKEFSDAKSVYDVAKKKVELCTSEEESAKAQLDKLKELLQVKTNTVKERKEQIASFAQKIPATEKSLKQAQKEFDDVVGREMESSKKLKNFRTMFDEKKSAMTASRSRNRVIDALMQEKRDGRIPGIHGRLGDLGAISSEYDVAISTCCGYLDYIVVDNGDTGKDCIDFLRNHDIGRANFIVLEKQHHLRDKCRERINTPENVPRLFDLVQVEEEKFLPAFYFALRNTLVAKDMEQGTRIAFGATRYRVVTLNGAVIEIAGTMTGGGNSVIRGKIGQSVKRSEPTVKDIELLEQELNSVYSETNQLKAQQAQLQNQITTLTTSLNEMLAEREKCDMEIRMTAEQLPELKKSLLAQEKKVSETTTDVKQLENLQKDEERAMKNMEEIEEKCQDVSSEVARVTKEIDKVLGGRTKEMEKNIAEFKKSIEKAKGEITRLEVEIKTSGRNAKKVEKLIEALESNKKKGEERLRKIQEERKVIEEEAMELMKSIKELEEGLKQRDELADGLKEELRDLEKREAKAKLVKIDLDQRLSEKNATVKELRLRIPDLEKRLGSLKLQPTLEEEVEPLVMLSDEELNRLAKTILAKLQAAKELLPKEVPNMHLIAEYQQKDELYLTRANELSLITNERNRLRDLYDDVRRRRNQEFIQGFEKITMKLKEMYQMITLGGDAELELVDSLDPFSEGITFSVRPSKKSWKNISNLSGGEKTLSSLALIFALHHYKPTPLYFMDEIDAALDFKNVSIVAHYIKERTKDAQFIIISLRSNMFELSNYLVGIYKTFNCTKCTMLDLERFEKSVCLENEKEADSKEKRITDTGNGAGASQSEDEML